jgi:uncharacterized protein
MTEQDNVATIRRVYEAFGRGDLAGVLGFMEPDLPWVTPGPADLPTAGRRRGLKQVEEFFGSLMSFGDIIRFEPTDFIAQNDKVVVLGEETYRVRATGNPVEFRWVHVFTLREGRIAAFEEVGDVSAGVAELRKAQLPA